MTLPSDALRESLEATRAKWGWFVALGVLLLIFGGIAFGNLFIATVASVYVVGSLMLAAGIVEIAHAFGVKTWSRFFYWLLNGLVYAIAGFLAFYNPLLASAILTFLLAVAGGWVAMGAGLTAGALVERAILRGAPRPGRDGAAALLCGLLPALAVALVASGLLRAWVGFSQQSQTGWGWVAASGVVTALAGLVIAMGWPVNSLWVLGMFLAIDLIFQGWSLIAVGLALKK